MNKKQYEEKRKSLMNEAQKLLDAGDAQKAQEKMNEVKNLDQQWDVIAQAMADFNTLNREPAALFNLENFKFGNLEESFGEGNGDDPEESEAVRAWKSEEYKRAWAKHLQGLQMTDSESRAYGLVNEAYTHTTKNTSIVIPKTVADGIWELVGESYPYFADVTKTYVSGVLSMVQEDTSSDAAWYEEADPVDDGKETFKEYTLNGCELSRDITVSWKLKEMAMEDFIPYIQRRMAKKMGAGAGYGVMYGVGPSEGGKKPEPTGVITALKKEAGTPQVVEYENAGVPTYDDVVSARGKIKGGYARGLNIYANSNTVWNKIARIKDQHGRPMFMVDPTTGGIRVLGMTVKEDDSMKDGDILLSNAGSGYHLNINKEITMMTEDHVKLRTTDYVGYAILDGNILTSKAHALLTEKAGE